MQSHATLISLVKVNTPAQTVTLAIYIRTSWIDERLAWSSSCASGNVYESVAVQGSPEGRVWVPSVFGENLRSKPERIEGAWWLGSDGLVWHERKEYWELMCDMDFTRMPFDKQDCFIRLATWAEDNKTVVLAATAGAEAINQASDTYALDGDVEWRFNTDESHTHRAYSQPDEFGNGYYVLDLFFQVERQPGHYYGSAINPVVLIVVFAYFSFWISRAAVPARVAIVVICYLALENKIGDISASLPKTKDDVWLLRYCLCARYFVLAAAIEYVFVNYLFRSEARIDKARAALRAEDAKEAAENSIVAEHSSRAGGETGAEASASCRKVQAAATAVTAVRVDVGTSASASARHHTNRDRLARRVGRIDRLFLSANGKGMWLNDQRLDICSRFVFPLVYALAVLGLFGEVM